MKEFVISEAKVETAILVGLITQTQDERKTIEYLDELEFLAQTAGAEVVRRFTQKLPCAHSVAKPLFTWISAPNLIVFSLYQEKLSYYPLDLSFYL